ncbi:MAG: Glutamine--fructose-6-phosphate aminotransferase [isomerizing] [Firmicutes bacterium]|nr:Glutamine--fructose-6-phosphate aminotransferase [isomerizing] [Bacillota bacterium]MDI6707347.1 glutamine--fructose-6-phosphate transaminase (isomerizing) [Bacillota bacterium]
MCGIVGYIGDKNATPILIDGLRRLEYRGYDSAGIAVYNGGEVEVKKYKGRLSILEERLREHPVLGSLGIGHTRWATHGEPSDVNSHPQTSMKGNIAIVHNGIIENFQPLKEWLIGEGYSFQSDTDTEVVAHLIDYYYDGSLEEAVIKTVERLEGSFALGIISCAEPDKMVAVRKDSPLIVGLGKGENFIASDIPAILEHTRQVYLLNEMEIAVLTKDSVKVLDRMGKPVNKEIFEVTWDVASAEKGGYPHFMLKEIYEQPNAIRQTLKSRLMSGKEDIVLDQIRLSREDLEKVTKINIVACGTAFHAGVVGKYLIEKLARIPVEADIASEFRYRNPILDDNSVVIVISQSGETADTLAAMREAKKRGARIIAVTNVVGSTVSREADDLLYTWAGPEIAVASTKAYTTQLIAMYLIALKLAKIKGEIDADLYLKMKEAVSKIPEQAEKVLELSDELKDMAERNRDAEDVFFIGRSLDYAVAMEGSLKLKEISYIHSEAYAAGELKHGTIALIEDGTLVFALATQDRLFDKAVSNMKEVKARGAYVVALAKEGNREAEKTADRVIYIPDTLDEFIPVLTVIPLQLFAYHIAVARGCDVDKPRNLAKSVTVE